MSSHEKCLPSLPHVGCSYICLALINRRRGPRARTIIGQWRFATQQHQAGTIFVKLMFWAYESNNIKKKKEVGEYGFLPPLFFNYFLVVLHY